MSTCKQFLSRVPGGNSTGRYVEPRDRRHRVRAASGFTLIEMMIVVSIMGILLALLLPNYQTATASSRLSACEQNLSNLSTAVSLYARDYNDQYPASLTLLLPTYVPSMPTCPGAGADTYTNGFSSVNTGLACYTLSCSGTNHSDKGLGAGFPELVIGVGLLTQ